MSALSSSREYQLPSSSPPRKRSSASEMGHATGSRSRRKASTSQMQRAPTASPCLEQIAWGMISPKMTMMAVDTSSPTAPDVTFASKMLMQALTTVLPSRSVHSRRLPRRRRGRMRAAWARSTGSPLSASTDSAVTSRPADSGAGAGASGDAGGRKGCAARGRDTRARFAEPWPWHIFGA